MKEAKTIDEVLNQLDQVIDETLNENSYASIFAYVYRRTTAQIKVAIDNKRFEDNERMEKMDVIFANFYIRAYHNYKINKPISESWKSSFDVQKKPITIIQHLLLGMNAHINLDLGQAAAEVAEPNKINKLESDFMEVNKVLAGLIDEMQNKLGKVSRMMILLDWIGKRSDEVLSNFSMVKARDQAWNLANELAGLNNKIELQNRVKIADENVAALSNYIIQPPGKLLKFVMKIIGLFEERSVLKIVKKLSDDDG